MTKPSPSPIRGQRERNWSCAFASYGAVFGDTYIRIGGLTYVTPDQGKQIVELLHSKIAS